MSDWAETTLGEICSKITDGSHNPPKGIDGGNFVMLSSKNILDDEITLKNPRYLGEADFGLENRRTEIQPGDVLLTIVGTVGRAAVVPDSMTQFTVQRSVAVLKPKHDRALPRFLMYALQHRLEALQSQSQGVAQKGIYLKALNSFPIELPLLEEQQRIVGVLDEAFAAIATATATAERNLASARGVLMSAIDEAFSEGVSDTASTELGALIEVTHGYAFDGSQFEPSDDLSKPIVLTPGNYTEDAALSFTPKNTKRLVSGAERSGFRFEIGDLTVVMTDLSSKMKILGRPAFVEEDNILHNQRIGRVVPKDDRVDLRLIYYFMQTSAALNRIRDTATGTMVRHTAPKRILSNIMNYPRLLDDQRNLVGRLDAISLETRALERIQIAKIAKLGQLKQSFLRSAFSGKIGARLAPTAV